MNLDYNYELGKDTSLYNLNELYNKWELEEDDYSKHLKCTKDGESLNIIYLITAYNYNMFISYYFIIYLYQITGLFFIPTPLIGIIKYF